MLSNPARLVAPSHPTQTPITMSDTFCVAINSCKQDPDKATVGFVVATAALGSGKDTLVFLSTDGVWAADKKRPLKSTRASRSSRWPNW